MKESEELKREADKIQERESEDESLSEYRHEKATHLRNLAVNAELREEEVEVATK